MTLKLRREHYVRLYLEVNSVLKNQDAGTKILDEFPRPTCRSVYTVSDKRLRHGGSGYETNHCLQILYPTNFLIEKVFYLLVPFIFSLFMHIIPMRN